MLTRTRRRRWLRVSSIALGLLAGVLLVELVFGSWIFGANNFWFLNVPRNIETKLDTSGVMEGGGTVVYRRDRYGLRGPYGDPAEVDILTVGGSTTAERLDAYESRLRRLDRLIRAFGATPIFVTQPRGDCRVVAGETRCVTPVAVDVHAALVLFNARTLEVCGDTGGICVDLAAELHFGDGDFYDVIHTTPQGSARIGKFLFGALGNRLTDARPATLPE